MLSISSGAEAGARMADMSSCRAENRASASASCLRFIRLVRSVTISWVASTPTSEVSSRVSISSSTSSSMAFLPSTRSDRPEVSPPRVRERPDFRRPKKPDFVLSGVSVLLFTELDTGAGAAVLSDLFFLKPNMDVSGQNFCYWGGS